MLNFESSYFLMMSYSIFSVIFYQYQINQEAYISTPTDICTD